MSVLLALFSALGAVLLFLLKLVGILLLIVMGFLALVLFCPFCADVQWEQGVFTVKAGALGLTFPVFQYPKPQPTEPEEPKGPLGKLKAKFRAWRAERKAKKAAAKAAKPAKPKKETSPRKKAKLTLNIICTMLRGAGRLTRAIFGALRFTKIRICLGVRGEDPAQAARTYGKLNAWLYTSLGVLDRFLFLAPPAGVRQCGAHRGRPGLVPGIGAAVFHRLCRRARSLRVLARKSAGRVHLIYVTIALYGEYCRVHLFPCTAAGGAGEISHKK